MFKQGLEWHNPGSDSCLTCSGPKKVIMRPAFWANAHKHNAPGCGCWQDVGRAFRFGLWFGGGGEVKTNIRQDSGSTFDSDKFGRHFTWLLFWVNHSVIFESHSLHYQGRPCATTSARAEGTESDANGLGGVQFWRLESSRQA